MADANGFTTVTNNKKKRRNRGKKAASAAEVPATKVKAATPAAQPEIPGVSSHMVPYMKAAAPHGFSLDEVKAMNDKMFADGSEVWNDPQAVLAELLKKRKASEDKPAEPEQAAPAPAETVPASAASASAASASSQPASASASAPAATESAGDRAAQLRKLASMPNVENAIKLMTTWCRRAPPAQVDAVFKSSAATLLLGNFIQQLPSADMDKPLRVLFSLLFRTPSSDGEQAKAGAAAASAIVSAVRAVVNKLAASAGDADDAAYRASMAHAVAAVAKRFGATAGAFRSQLRALSGTPAEEEALAAASSMAMADLLTLEKEANRLVAANGLPPTYKQPVQGSLAPTASAELRVLVQQRDATVVMVDTALERLAATASASSAAPAAPVVASTADASAFDSALQPLSGHAEPGADKSAEAARSSIESLKSTVQSELEPLVQKDAQLRNKLQNLTAERDALVAKVEELSVQIREAAAERAANASKRDAVAMKHKGTAVDLDKQYRQLQVAGARASAAQDIKVAADSLEHQLSASVADLGKQTAALPVVALQAARSEMLNAAAKHLTVEAALITRLQTRADSAVVEVGKLQSEAATYRKMGMQNVLDGVLAKIQQLQEHSVADKESAAALRQQATDVLADVAARLRGIVYGPAPVLSVTETSDLTTVHNMAKAAQLQGIAALPPLPAASSAPPGLPAAVEASVAAPVASAAPAAATEAAPSAAQRERKPRGGATAGVAAPAATAAPAVPGVPGLRGFGRGVKAAAGSAPAPVPQGAAGQAAAPAKKPAATWAPPASGGWGKKSTAPKKSFAAIKAEAAPVEES